MKKLIPLFIAIMALCVACDEDFFETTLKVDPPPHEDQLVLHSYIKSNDSLMRFSLNKSFSILGFENDEDGFIDDATIEIFEDGVLKYTPELSGETPFNYVQLLDGPIGGEGKSYEIKITQADLGEISSTQIMPAVPVLVSAKFDEEGGIGGEIGERASSIDVIIDDPADETNFYEIVVLYKSDDPLYPFSYSVYTETFDVNATEGFNYSHHLLDDATFNGTNYTFRMETDNEYNEELYVTVRSISRDWYLYSKSVSDFQDNADLALFAEPVTIHSNINNGLGVFALGSAAEIKIELE